LTAPSNPANSTNPANPTITRKSKGALKEIKNDFGLKANDKDGKSLRTSNDSLEEVRQQMDSMDLQEGKVPPSAPTVSITGFDVLIISCSGTEQAADLWQARVEMGRGSLLPSHCRVVAVAVAWQAPIGNG
jgi:hypothetical protein